MYEVEIVPGSLQLGAGCPALIVVPYCQPLPQGETHFPEAPIRPGYRAGYQQPWLSPNPLKWGPHKSFPYLHPGKAGADGVCWPAPASPGVHPLLQSILFLWGHPFPRNLGFTQTAACPWLQNKEGTLAWGGSSPAWPPPASRGPANHPALCAHLLARNKQSLYLGFSDLCLGREDQVAFSGAVRPRPAPGHSLAM